MVLTPWMFASAGFNGSTGVAAWANASAITADDGTEASVALNAISPGTYNYSDRLAATFPIASNLPVGSTVTAIEVEVVGFRSDVATTDLFLEGVQFFAQQVFVPVGSAITPFPSVITTLEQTGLVSESLAVWGLSGNSNVLSYGGVTQYLRHPDCFIAIGVISETDYSPITCYVDALRMRINYIPPARSGVIGGSVGRGIIL